jgi:hypothetical protein
VRAERAGARYALYLLYWYSCCTGTLLVLASPQCERSALGARYSLYLLYWYKSGLHCSSVAAVTLLRSALEHGYSIYLLYWYKSTSTDAEVAAAANLTEAAGMLGGFTCFTGTKVPALTQKWRQRRTSLKPPACLEAPTACWAAAKSRPPRRLLSFLALLVQKYKYCGQRQSRGRQEGCHTALNLSKT